MMTMTMRQSAERQNRGVHLHCFQWLLGRYLKLSDYTHGVGLNVQPTLKDFNECLKLNI